MVAHKLAVLGAVLPEVWGHVLQFGAYMLLGWRACAGRCGVCGRMRGGGYNKVGVGVMVWRVRGVDGMAEAFKYRLVVARGRQWGSCVGGGHKARYFWCQDVCWQQGTRARACGGMERRG